MKRSNTKPILWLLFSIGGTVAAFVIPIIITVLGILHPLDLLPASLLSFQMIEFISSYWIARVIVAGILITVLWHAMHRLFLTMLDLYLCKDKFSHKIVFYGIASAGILATLFLMLIL